MVAGIAVELVLPLVSAFVGIVALWVNWSLADRKLKQDLRLKRDADVLAWGDAAITALAEAGTLGFRASEGEGDALTRECQALTARLTAIVDRGRFFFPSEILPRPVKAEIAFRGIRPPILDALVFAAAEVDAIRRATQEARRSLGDESASFLVECRRLVVTELQNAVDPRRNFEIVQALAQRRANQSSYERQTSLAERFGQRHPDHPIFASWAAIRRMAKHG